MSNIDATTKAYAEKMTALLDEQAKTAGALKELRAEIKAEGYNLKAVNQVVKELRKGAQFQADQLMLELELDTYRKSVGLPVTVEDAQERARREAATMGDDEAGVFGENDTVRFGDGPEIPAREFARAAKGKGRMQ